MDVIQDKMKAAKKQVDGLTAAIAEKRGANVDVEEPCLPTVITTQGGHNQNDPKKLRFVKLLNGHFGKVYALHWSSDDTEKLVSASQDGKLIIWHAPTGAKTAVIPLRSSWVMTCAFGTDGVHVASGGLDNLCSIYKANPDPGSASRATRELTAHEGYISSCRFINPSTILTASGDSTCRLWNIETGDCIDTFVGHDGDCMSVSPSPTDPNLFVSGSCDTTAKIWDIRTPQECVQNFLGHESDLNSVAFLGNGMGFGSASDDSSCRLFDLRSYGQVNCFASDKFTCGITSVDFSKSGRYLFAGYENATCQIWDTFGAGKTPVQSIGGSVGHENRVSCVGVNNGRNGTGGTALCTGSWDMSLKVWA